jgi:hypothetical protein
MLHSLRDTKWWMKARNPVILVIIHHYQNTSELTCNNFCFVQGNGVSGQAVLWKLYENHWHETGHATICMWKYLWLLWSVWLPHCKCLLNNTCDSCYVTYYVTVYRWLIYKQYSCYYNCWLELNYCQLRHLWDCLCDLVVRVLGYRSGVPGSIPSTTRRRKKSNGSGTRSTQPRKYNWGATW